MHIRRSLYGSGGALYILQLKLVDNEPTYTVSGLCTYAGAWSLVLREWSWRQVLPQLHVTTLVI